MLTRSTDSGTETASGRSRRRGLVLAVAALVAVGGLGAVYGIVGFGRNPEQAAACQATRQVVKRVEPLVRGEVAALSLASNPRPLPELAFTDRDGQRRTLADWRGRTVLLNLWATWCVPCRREMPALDALQAKLGSPAFEVVAVNIDTRDPEKPKTWLRDNKVDQLAYYADPQAKTFQELKAVGKAFGMPTTVVIDPAGCEIASLAGPAEWASEDALAFLRSALGG